jgi:glutaconyl-CoA decarboxylase
MAGQSYNYVVKVGDKAYNVVVRPVGSGKFKVVVEDTELDVLVEGGQIVTAPQPTSVVKPPAEVKPSIIPTQGGTVASEPRKPEATSQPTAQPAVSPVPPSAPTVPAATPGGAVVSAPIPGKVLKVLVNPGDSVNPGKLVATLESMKMEVEVFSDKGGRVKEVRVRPGDFVNVGDALIVLE